MFERSHKVRFGEVDYAGIMYYPRYFEALNATVEDWFGDAAQLPFQRLLDHFDVGSPLVAVETDFTRPCRLGDALVFRLSVTKLGKSSIGFRAETYCGDELRMRSQLTHVCVNMAAAKAVPWPEEVRARLSHLAKEDA